MSNVENGDQFYLVMAANGVEGVVFDNASDAMYAAGIMPSSGIDSALADMFRSANEKDLPLKVQSFSATE